MVEVAGPAEVGAASAMDSDTPKAAAPRRTRRIGFSPTRPAGAPDREIWAQSKALRRPRKTAGCAPHAMLGRGLR